MEKQWFDLQSVQKKTDNSYDKYQRQIFPVMYTKELNNEHSHLRTLIAATTERLVSTSILCRNLYKGDIYLMPPDVIVMLT